MRFYETVLVERRGAVTLVTPEPATGVERPQQPGC